MSDADAPSRAPRTRHGRPVVTTHGAIERAAFTLFRSKGFDETTMDDIARAVGVSRRTLFRYFGSKNDIPWGRFDDTIAAFRRMLADAPPDQPLADSLSHAVAEFNRFPDDADPPHRERIRLILETPALQAHSTLQYRAWRGVVADFIAERLDLSPADPLPTLIGYSSLAIALSAYEDWIRAPDRDLPTMIEDNFAHLREFFPRS